MPDRPLGVLFDIGGVLIRTPFEMLAYHSTHNDIPVTWRGPFAPETDDLFQQVVAGELSEREYWKLRTAELRAHFSGESRDEIIASIFRLPERDVLRYEMIELIDNIQASGVTTGLLTNDLGKFHGDEWETTLPTLKRLGRMVDLSFTNTLKPHPDSYRLGVDALDLAPEQVLFVDDQPVNVQGAVAAGLQTHHFDVVNPAESVRQISDRLGLDA